MTDQRFKYTTADGEEHKIEISWLHMAKTELEINVSALEWSLRIEPHLRAAHKAWLDRSSQNNEHFLEWCGSIVSVDDHKPYVSTSHDDKTPVPYRVFVEAERFFDKRFTDLMLNNSLTLRLFVVWKVFYSEAKDFYKWLELLPAEFECDLITEGADGDAGPKD